MTLEFSDIGILADDLTGACDAAACFAPGNGPVAVQVAWGRGTEESIPDAVINTRSRLLKPDEARAVLRSAGKRLSGKPVIFKKIDSALRGPVGAELAGLIEGTGERNIILAPAIPRIGRTVRNGVIYDSGAPIDRTPYAGDAASPVDSADIGVNLLRTARVPCEIPDAVTDADLQQIVEHALGIIPVVLAGSIGLGDALARMVAARAWKVAMKPARRVAIVCGSSYRRSLDQIQAAADHFGREAAVIDGTVATHLRDILRRGGPTVIIRLDTAGTPAEFISAIEENVPGLVREFNPDGMGIIGGETAYHLLRSLGTTRMDVHGRIGDVMTWGVVRDGFPAGCRFATKGGSVGPDDAVVRMIQHLQGTRL